jgi:hypothetical protein
MLTNEEMREAILRLTKERNDALFACENMERSANSAREIARVAMSHTGTRVIRVELTYVGDRLNLVLCAPADDERDLVKRLASMLNPAIIDALGLDATAEPIEVGATK